MTLYARSDVNDFYREVLNDSSDTDKKVTRISLKKRIFYSCTIHSSALKNKFRKNEEFFNGVVW